MWCKTLQSMMSGSDSIEKKEEVCNTIAEQD